MCPLALIVRGMQMAESYKLPTLDRWVTLALFTDVSNAGKLRSEATSGGIMAALLDPTLVSAHLPMCCMDSASRSA